MHPTRREVLVCTLCAMACGPGGSAPDPTASDAPVPTGDTAPPPWSPCVEPGDASSGWVEIPMPAELAEVGGSVSRTIAGEDMVVAQVEEGCFVAVSRRCTHQGAAVEYVQSRNGFVCPRHGAAYDLQGRRISGPAPQDLTSYPCGERDGSLWVLLT
ncbi:MAG: Rieske (2Fe-2S) protein [Myxococcales bacterium]|nr:Rieske (2Fe-2S) protein [Myxococcales bacterium]